MAAFESVLLNEPPQEKPQEEVPAPKRRRLTLPHEVTTEHVGADIDSIVSQADDEAMEGFRTLPDAANTEPFVDSVSSDVSRGLAHGLDDSELPVVTELEMDEFHSGLSLEPLRPAHGVEFSGLSDADKDAVFAEAKKRADGLANQENETGEDPQQRVAEGILRAKQLLDDAERRMFEAEQRYAQAETDRLGWQAKAEETSDVSSQQEYVRALRVANELKAELKKRVENTEKMRAAYGQVTRVIHH